MVRACQLDPHKFISICFNFLQNENEIIVLEFIMFSLLNTINNFINFNDQPLFKKKYLSIIQEFFYTKFFDLKNTTVLVMLDLIDYQSQEDMEGILSFLQKLKTGPFNLMKSQSEVIENHSDFKNFDLEGLNLETKKRLVQSIFEADYFDIKLKNELLESILGESIDDKYFKYTLEAAQPDKQMKKTIWNNLIYSSSEKSKINEAYMKGFAPKSQYKLLKNYFKDRFFIDFADVKNNNSTEYALKFLKYIGPSFIVEDDVLSKYEYYLKSSLDKHEYQIISEVDKGKFFYFNYFISD